MSTIAVTSISRRGVARAGRPSSRRGGSLRLTRRGRLVVFVSSLVLVAAVLLVLAGSAIGTGAAGEPVPTRTVTIQPGDTLWGIASRVAPQQDPRDVIDRIAELNTIGSTLPAGDKIEVPTRW